MPGTRAAGRLRQQRRPRLDRVLRRRRLGIVPSPQLGCALGAGALDADPDPWLRTARLASTHRGGPRESNVAVFARPAARVQCRQEELKSGVRAPQRLGRLVGGEPAPATEYQALLCTARRDVHEPQGLLHLRVGLGVAELDQLPESQRLGRGDRDAAFRTGPRSGLPPGPEAARRPGRDGRRRHPARGPCRRPRRRRTRGPWRRGRSSPEPRRGPRPAARPSPRARRGWSAPRAKSRKPRRSRPSCSSYSAASRISLRTFAMRCSPPPHREDREVVAEGRDRAVDQRVQGTQRGLARAARRAPGGNAPDARRRRRARSLGPLAPPSTVGQTCRGPSVRIARAACRSSQSASGLTRRRRARRAPRTGARRRAGSRSTPSSRSASSTCCWDQ